MRQARGTQAAFALDRELSFRLCPARTWILGCTSQGAGRGVRASGGARLLRSLLCLLGGPRHLGGLLERRFGLLERHSGLLECRSGLLERHAISTARSRLRRRVLATSSALKSIGVGAGVPTERHGASQKPFCQDNTVTAPVDGSLRSPFLFRGGTYVVSHVMCVCVGGGGRSEAPTSDTVDASAWVLIVWLAKGGVLVAPCGMVAFHAGASTER